MPNAKKVPSQAIFNGPIELGLRSLAVLTSAFPDVYTLQRLVIFDYFVVHSDDLPHGPVGLHPKTPYRGGEILVRRGLIQRGLRLYESRSLIERRYGNDGLAFAATDLAASFLDTLDAEYVRKLRERAGWVVETLGLRTDHDLERLAHAQVGQWGAEFVMDSVLWSEER